MQTLYLEAALSTSFQVVSLPVLVLVIVPPPPGWPSHWEIVTVIEGKFSGLVYDDH